MIPLKCAFKGHARVMNVKREISWSEISYIEYYRYYKYQIRKGSTKGNTVLKKTQLIRALKRKRNAIGQSKERLEQEAHEIGISLNTAYRWIRQLKNAKTPDDYLDDKRNGGNRRSLIDDKIREKIVSWLSERQGKNKEFRALRNEIERRFGKNIPYSTICYYANKILRL